AARHDGSHVALRRQVLREALTREVHDIFVALVPKPVESGPERISGAKRPPVARRGWIAPQGHLIKPAAKCGILEHGPAERVVVDDEIALPVQHALCFSQELATLKPV